MNPDKKNPNPDPSMNADISRTERELLDDSLINSSSRDNDQLRKAALDNTDEDGEPLNEATFGNDLTGNDLDVPGSEADDANEEIGEEDEENNSYSQADTE